MTAPLRTSGSSLASRLARAGATVSATLQSLITWLPLAIVLALCPGLFVWPAIHRDRLAYVFDNHLAPPDRAALVVAVLASLFVVGAAYALLLERARAAAPDRPWAPLCATINDKLLGLLALPLVPPLMAPGVESRSPLFALLLIAAITAIVSCWVYRQLPRVGAPEKRPWPLPALAITAALATAQGLFFAWLAIRRHHALDTRIFDLGIYDNILWNTSHGDLLRSTFVRSQSHVAAHVDPILVLLAPLYRLAPRAETLLAFQALWLASGAVPLHLLADKLLRSPIAAIVVASSYLLHPALHGACLFDFHSLTLAIPLCLWALYALEARGALFCAAAFALLLLCREDAAFLAASIALFALLAGRRSTVGLVALVAAAGYFVALKLFVMPQASLLMRDSANSYSYESFYSDLIPAAGQGMLGIFASIVTNPAYVLAYALSRAKQRFLLVMFVPTLGLPMLARPGRVLLVYGLAFTLLSSRPALYLIGFQYVAVLLPFALALVPYALAWLRQRPPLGLDGARLFRGLVVGIAVASALTSWKFGAILPSSAFRPGDLPLLRRISTERALAYDALGRALAEIPAGASLAVGDRLGPHASNRSRVERFTATSVTDYVLVEPLFVADADRGHLDDLRRSPKYRTLLESAGVLLLGPATP